VSSKGPSGVTVEPPVEPMLAKLAEELPPGAGYLYEPKWDGFRAIVFRGRDDVYIQSRDSRPLDRYFPELHDALLERLPKDCVVDGEIVIATAQGLDFDALQLRLHPAESRVVKLAKDTPSSFVAFDVLAVSGRNLLVSPQFERRAVLEKLLRAVKPPVYLTPVTRDRAVALEWLTRFEGAGLDGVIAKPESGAYLPGKRAMIKVKHARTADCVVVDAGSTKPPLYPAYSLLETCSAMCSCRLSPPPKERVQPSVSTAPSPARTSTKGRRAASDEAVRRRPAIGIRTSANLVRAHRSISTRHPGVRRGVAVNHAPD
jgi:ATP-dependent DNA ligase